VKALNQQDARMAALRVSKFPNTEVIETMQTIERVPAPMVRNTKTATV